MKSIDNVNLIANFDKRSSNIDTNKNYDIAEAKKVGQDFEAVFIGKMLNIVFDMVKPNKLFGGGAGEKMFKSLLIDEYAKEISKKDALHVGQYVTDFILKFQEVKDHE